MILTFIFTPIHTKNLPIHVENSCKSCRTRFVVKESTYARLRLCSASRHTHRVRLARTKSKAQDQAVTIVRRFTSPSLFKNAVLFILQLRKAPPAADENPIVVLPIYLYFSAFSAFSLFLSVSLSQGICAAICFPASALPGMAAPTKSKSVRNITPPSHPANLPKRSPARLCLAFFVRLARLSATPPSSPRVAPRPPFRP